MILSFFSFTMPFCPVCGTMIAQGEEFCPKHKKTSLDVKPFDVRVCTCGRLFANNHWFYPPDMEQSIIKIVRDHVKQKVSVALPKIDIPPKRGQKIINIAKIFLGDVELEVKFPVKVLQCDKCAKLGTHYFTAKLQLRDPPADVLPFIEDYLAPFASRGVAVNKVEETLHGPDLFLTHKKTASQLGEKLVRRFGGTLNSSEQLFSRNRQTSKNLYRLNVLVQFPHFSIGSVVVLGKRVVLVTGLGKSCTGRDLALDKKVVFVAGDESKVLKKESATVSVTHPSVEVVHPRTFQQVPVRNAVLPDLKPGVKVDVVEFDDNLFIIPK